MSEELQGRGSHARFYTVCAVSTLFFTATVAATTSQIHLESVVIGFGLGGVFGLLLLGFQALALRGPPQESPSPEDSA